MTSVDSNSPVAKYSEPTARGAINIAVWERQGKSEDRGVFTFNTVTVDRRYIDSETDEWKSSNSFTMSELKKLHWLLSQVLVDFGKDKSGKPPERGGEQRAPATQRPQ